MAISNLTASSLKKNLLVFLVVVSGYCLCLCQAFVSPQQQQQQQQQQHTSSASFVLSMTSTEDSSSATASASTSTTVPPETTKTKNMIPADASVPTISGIRDVVDQYDCFLIDMWGVMHDGQTCYDGVIDCIYQLKSKGKDLIILSNSSKRKDNCYKMLTKLGLDPIEDFTQIITSGEVAHHLLRHLSTLDDESTTTTTTTASTLAGADNGLSSSSSSSSSWVPQDIPPAVLRTSSSTLKVFCFGSGDGDAEYLTSCGWGLANSMDDADLIVARGPFTILTAQGQISRPEPTGKDKIQDVDDDSKSSTTDYETAMDEALQVAAKRQIPMIVANPDKVRPDADKSPMPGTIGVAYEQLLLQEKPDMTPEDIEGLVLYLGKPFKDVYEIALRGRDPSKACMVGDALETDITGANTAGIDSIWVINDGIHNEAVEQEGNGSLKDGCHSVLHQFNSLDNTYAKGRRLKPSFILPHFRW